MVQIVILEKYEGKGTFIKININKYQNKYQYIDMQGVWRVLEHVHIFWIDWHVVKLNIYQNCYSIFLRGMKMCLSPFEKSVKKWKRAWYNFYINLYLVAWYWTSLLIVLISEYLLFTTCENTCIQENK